MSVLFSQKFSKIFLATFTLFSTSLALADSYPTGLPNTWNESNAPTMNLLAPKANMPVSSSSSENISPSKKPVTTAYETSTDTLVGTGQTLRPVVSLGLGLSFTKSVGSSESFPPAIPGEDKFYLYDAASGTQSKGLIDLFAGLEWAFNPNWALQAGFGYSQIGTYNATGTFVQGFVEPIVSQPYNYSYSVATQQFMLDGKILYTMKSNPRCHPYFSFGLGDGYNKAYNYTNSVTGTSTRNYDGNSINSFSYSAGVGMDVDATKHIRIGGGYRFSELGRVELGSSNVNFIPVPGTIAQSHLYTNEVMGQVSYLF